MSVIYLFIALNALIFFLPTLIPFRGEGYDSFSSFLAMGEKSNVKIKDGEFYRLFTSIFLHVNVVHLVFNMYVLWSLFPQVLSTLNPSIALPGFFVLYFISGIAGSVSSFFVNPNPSVGASGAIFGLIGAVLFFAISNGLITLVINMLIFIAVNLFLGFQLKQVDNSSHIGGLIAGFVLMPVFTLLFP